jgi:SOS response regulatory protein OraA/RecX
MDEKRKAYLKNRLWDLLTLRDHSEQELKQKLRSKVTQEELQFLLELAKDYRLIPTSCEEKQNLAQRVFQSYHKKKMGSLKIQQKLKEKGLPTVSVNSEEELTLAKQLLTTRRSRSQKTLTKPQLFRYLLGKGFPSHIVQKALNELDEGNSELTAYGDSYEPYSTLSDS